MFDPGDFSFPHIITFFGVLYSSMYVFVSFIFSFFPSFFFRLNVLLLLRLLFFREVEILENFFLFSGYSLKFLPFFLCKLDVFFKLGRFLSGEELLSMISDFIRRLEDFFFDLLLIIFKNFSLFVAKLSLFSHFDPLSFSPQNLTEVAKREGLVSFLAYFFFRSSDSPSKSNSFMITPSSLLLSSVISEL